MNNDVEAFEIRAAHDGYRRGGRAWTTTPQIVPAEDLTAEQIEALEADHRISIREAKAEADASQDTDEVDAGDGDDGQGTDRHMQLVEAIGQIMAEDNPADVTGSGKPKIEAIQSRLPNDAPTVTAAERDAAFADWV